MPRRDWIAGALTLLCYVALDWAIGGHRPLCGWDHIFNIAWCR